MENLNESRRKVIEESVHTISVEGPTAPGEGLFPDVDHPWRNRFFEFINETAPLFTTRRRTTASTSSTAGTRKRGMWFLPGSGMGPLREKGLKALKESVDKK